MHVLQNKLFLGLELNPQLRQLLSLLNPRVVSSFINEDPCYLQETLIAGKAYLGKALDAPTDTTIIDQSVPNVLSLLQRLFPEHSPKSQDLQLLAYPTD